MNISDIEDPEYFIGKKDKASIKALAFLDQLLKNKTFLKKIRRLEKEVNNEKNFKKFPRIYPIPEKLKEIKRDALSATNNKYNRIVDSLIAEYGINEGMIDIARAMQKKLYDHVKMFKNDVSLCTINDDYSNTLYPLNEGDDFVYYNGKLKRRIMAYPISVGISPRATKTDVLDFIEKNWWWITKDEYDKKLKELKEKQYDINIQIEDHTRADENYYITASTVLNLSKRAKELFESSEIPEKRAILNYLLQNCVANGNKLEFSLRSPYNHILNLANQPTMLGR